MSIIDLDEWLQNKQATKEAYKDRLYEAFADAHNARLKFAWAIFDHQTAWESADHDKIHVAASEMSEAEEEYQRTGAAAAEAYQFWCNLPPVGDH